MSSHDGKEPRRKPRRRVRDQLVDPALTHADDPTIEQLNHTLHDPPARRGGKPRRESDASLPSEEPHSSDEYEPADAVSEPADECDDGEGGSVDQSSIPPPLSPAVVEGFNLNSIVAQIKNGQGRPRGHPKSLPYVTMNALKVAMADRDDFRWPRYKLPKPILDAMDETQAYDWEQRRSRFIAHWGKTAEKQKEWLQLYKSDPERADWWIHGSHHLQGALARDGRPYCAEAELPIGPRGNLQDPDDVNYEPPWAPNPLEIDLEHLDGESRYLTAAGERHFIEKAEKDELSIWQLFDLEHRFANGPQSMSHRVIGKLVPERRKKWNAYLNYGFDPEVAEVIEQRARDNTITTSDIAWFFRIYGMERGPYAWRNCAELQPALKEFQDLNPHLTWVVTDGTRYRGRPSRRRRMGLSQRTRQPAPWLDDAQELVATDDEQDEDDGPLFREWPPRSRKIPRKYLDQDNRLTKQGASHYAELARSNRLRCWDLLDFERGADPDLFRDILRGMPAKTRKSWAFYRTHFYDPEVKAQLLEMGKSEPLTVDHLNWFFKAFGMVKPPSGLKESAGDAVWLQFDQEFPVRARQKHRPNANRRYFKGTEALDRKRGAEEAGEADDDEEDSSGVI